MDHATVDGLWIAGFGALLSAIGWAIVTYFRAVEDRHAQAEIKWDKQATINTDIECRVSILEHDKEKRH